MSLKNIKIFLIKIFLLFILFPTTAISKSPPPGTISSADASKINVLLMLSEGRHWNQERRDHLYSNGGRREHACSILFNWDGYHRGNDIVFHNDHVFMASDLHGFPDDIWEGSMSNRDGVNTIREKFKYPQHIWKGFRGITKHKIGDECTLDKSWAYDGQYSSFDIFKNGGYASPRDMFKALDPLNHRWDKDTVCVGNWQDDYQKYKLFKLKTKNNKTRLFAILRNRLCEFDLNTGKMTPITHFYGRSGWDPMAFSCVLRGKSRNDCRKNDLVFSSEGDNFIFEDFKNGRIRSNGWFATFRDRNESTNYKNKKNFIFDFKNYNGKITDVQETVCPSWQELYDNKWTDAEKKFWNINRVYGDGWGTQTHSRDQEYDYINGGIAHLTQWRSGFHTHRFSNDGKYLWGTSHVPNKGHTNSFVIKKLKLEDNGCIEKGSWDIVSAPVDLHNAEMPFGSGWVPFTGHQDDWKTWMIDNQTITEHPTDPKTFFFTAGGYAKRAIVNKNIPIPKDPYRSFVYKVTFNDDYSKIVSTKKVMFKGGWGDLHNPGKNLGFRVEQNLMLSVPQLRILGINENKNEMYLSTLGRGQTNVGFSAFVIDTNTLAFKRVFGGTDTSGVNKKDQESAALEAMLPVLSNSSITSQINFGFGLHSRNGISTILYNPNTGRPNWGTKPPNWIYSASRDPHFKNWKGDLTTGYAEPCTNHACLKVRIHDKGAEQIKKYFEERINFKVDPNPTTYDYNDPLSGTGLLGIPYFSRTDGYKASAFMGPLLAYDYLKHPTLSPRDPKTPCASTYVVYLLPGGGGISETSYNSHYGKSPQRLFGEENIKSYVFVYGDLPPENTITSTSWDSNLREYRKINAFGSQHRRLIDKLAKESGTEKGIYVEDTTQLTGAFNSLMLSIIEDAKKVSFSAPSVINEANDKNSAYQAKLQFVSKQQWQGELISRKLTAAGIVDKNAKPNWEASKKIASPLNRKIWSEIPGVSYAGNYNNFTETNALAINTLFELTGNKVADYHSQTTGPTNTQRCKSTSGVSDGNFDDIKGLINFIRGADYFDYDADCDLNEKLKNPLADIYHSEMLVVGAPNASSTSNSENSIAYFRGLNNYASFAQANEKRKKVIYVGANNGILHAFNADTGQELWGFVPPLLAGKFPTIFNTSLNTSKEGGSNAIYGVDGSPVVSDLYIKSPLNGAKQWHTILMIPYGRGGEGFSVLDVTNPDKPIHFYSIFNDKNTKKIHVINHRGQISSYDHDTVPAEYDYTKLGQTWSSPRITRIPNRGAGDNLLDDDINVAIMGGGYDDTDPEIGSNLTIVNLDDFGKIQKVIPIKDIANNGITNSVTSSPVVITPDTVGNGKAFKGALVYVNDLEGKVTKINLTNMKDDGNGGFIQMYDSTQIFNVDANDKNGRYMYHSMDAGIGQDTKNLWLFAGTGDFKRINSRNDADNLLLGIKDRYFPYYRQIPSSNKSSLFNCKDTTYWNSDRLCEQLMKPSDDGWYIKLPKSLKVSAEPTVHLGLVYFPTYQPGGCNPGQSSVCSVNDECGTNKISGLRNANRFLNLKTPGNNALKSRCMYVGEGVLSKIVITPTRLYSNIAGEINEDGEDLVVLEYPPGELIINRSSWRENF